MEFLGPDYVYLAFLCCRDESITEEKIASAINDGMMIVAINNHHLARYSDVLRYFPQFRKEVQQ